MANSSAALSDRKGLALAVIAALLLGLATFAGWRWSQGADPFGGLFGDDADTSSLSNDIADATSQMADRIGGALGALLSRSPGERTVGMIEKGKGGSTGRSARRSPIEEALARAFPSPEGARRVIAPRDGDTPFGGIVLPNFAEPVAPFADALPGGDLPGGGGSSFFGPIVPGGPGGVSIGGGGGTGGGGGGTGGGGAGGGGGGTGGGGTGGGGGGTGGGGTGGGGGGTGGGGTNPPPPIVPAIPEPSTWLMLLMGFAVTGMALRRDKSLAQSIRSCV